MGWDPFRVVGYRVDTLLYHPGPLRRRLDCRRVSRRAHRANGAYVCYGTHRCSPSSPRDEQWERPWQGCALPLWITRGRSP